MTGFHIWPKPKPKPKINFFCNSDATDPCVVPIRENEKPKPECDEKMKESKESNETLRTGGDTQILSEMKQFFSLGTR